MVQEKHWPTLYKMTNTGKIQQWKIGATLSDCGKTGVYVVIHGQQDGKQQTTSTEITSGKNLGKSNETSIWQQTQLEAQALWTKQQERKGYTQKVPSEKPLLPMLAKSYDKERAKIDLPAFLQPKLDGMRCIAHQDGLLTSRTNKEIKSVPHIADTVCRMGLKYALDGELYCHGTEFQKLMSAIRKDKPTEASAQVQYWVYDIVAEDLDYLERQAYLKANLMVTDKIKFVSTHEVSSFDEIDSHLDSYLAKGFEGVMVRNKLGGYKINGRSSDLQKVKKFQDQEFEIIDVVEGKGKFKGLGILVLQTTKGVQFNATPEGTEEQRREYFENRDSYIGQLGTVKFFEWTTPSNPDEAVPRFPIFKAVRNE